MDGPCVHERFSFNVMCFVSMFLAVVSSADGHDAFALEAIGRID
jgi:hypothetical protein